MVVLPASTAPFRTASAMSSCRGTLLGHRMSGILPYSGQDMLASWDCSGLTDLDWRWYNDTTVLGSSIMVLRILDFYSPYRSLDTDSIYNADTAQERGK